MAAERWMLQTKKADFHEMARIHHITPVTARIIRNRDIVGEEAVEKYLRGSLKDQIGRASCRERVSSPV